MPICTTHTPQCSCGVFNSKRRVNPLKVDPSRTLGLQKRFQADLTRRLKALQTAIRIWLVRDDELGLVTNVKTHAFDTTSKKANAFKLWLDDQVKKGFLTEDASKTYVTSSYKQGLSRAYDQAKPSAGVDPKFHQGSKAQFMASAFGGGENIDTLELLATRTFNNIEGLTNDMKLRLNRILVEGMAKGGGAESMAKRMVDELKGMTLARARTIARTEIAHAQAEGQLDGFEALGLDAVDLDAELSTAFDACPQCEAVKAKGPYSIEQARGLIPIHPNCRCGWVLVVK